MLVVCIAHLIKNENKICQLVGQSNSSEIDLGRSIHISSTISLLFVFEVVPLENDATLVVWIVFHV